MRKTLFEISHEHTISSSTLRVAIHRGLLEADKVGHIRMVDDEGESFKKYLAQYNARTGRSKSADNRRPTEFSQTSLLTPIQANEGQAK